MLCFAISSWGQSIWEMYDEFKGQRAKWYHDAMCMKLSKFETFQKLYFWNVYLLSFRNLQIV